MTTTNPIRKMMPTALPRNLNMKISGRAVRGPSKAKRAGVRRKRPSGDFGDGRGEIGSREWDRTTDHLHVKEVLYH